MDFMNSDMKNSFEPDPEDFNKNKDLTILAYLGLLFLVPMLMCKESKYAQYHVKQGINALVIFAIAFTVVGILVRIVHIIMHLIPFLGPVISAVFSTLLGGVCTIAFIATMAVGIYNTVNGRTIPPLFMGSIQLIK